MDYRKTITKYVEKRKVRLDRGAFYTESWSTPICAQLLSKRFIPARGFMFKSNYLLVLLYTIKDAL